MSKRYQLKVQFTNISEVIRISQQLEEISEVYVSPSMHQMNGIKVRASSVMGLFSFNLSQPVVIWTENEESYKSVVQIINEEGVMICNKE